MIKAHLKQQADGKWVVRDPRSGRFLEIRGANALKASQFPLKENVDLTKPIAEQVFSEPAPKGTDTL